MATLAGTGFPLLSDVVKTLRPDGSPETEVIDILSEEMAILDDIPWEEGNEPGGSQITSATGLPDPEWTSANIGVTPQFGTTTQYLERCGILEQLVTVDVKVAEYGGSGNTAAYRMLQNRMALEGFRKKLESALFYENALTAPERIHGLASRYSATTGKTASAYTFINSGTHSGSDNQSIWLLNWGPGRLYGIFPKGMVGGLQHDDMGKELMTVNSKQLRVWRDWYQWKCGIAVPDYRHAARYQWDPSDTTNFAASAKGAYLALNTLIGAVRNMDQSERARFYGNRTSLNLINAQLISNDVNALTYIELGKRRVMAFFGVPWRTTDRLIAEDAIS